MTQSELHAESRNRQDPYLTHIERRDRPGVSMFFRIIDALVLKVGHSGPFVRKGVKAESHAPLCSCGLATTQAT